LCDKA